MNDGGDHEGRPGDVPDAAGGPTTITGAEHAGGTRGDLPTQRTTDTTDSPENPASPQNADSPESADSTESADSAARAEPTEGSAGAEPVAPAAGESSAPGSGEPPGDAPEVADPAPRGPRRRRRRWLRALTVSLLAVLVLALAGGGWLYWRTEQSLNSIERIPEALPTIPEEEQPAEAAGDAEVYLLVGLDAETRPDAGGDGSDTDDAPVWQAGAARSDTMMLLHLPADRSGATLVSLPRDSWVEIPGHGRAKLNAAYSWGGPPLMVETVQNLTDLRIDHVAVLDWSGFRGLTDAVGGVVIDGRRMDGEAALAYVRERKNLPQGDFDRTRRQQHFLRSLLSQTLSSGTLTNPSRLNGLLDSVGDVVSVDDRLSNSDLRGLAWELRGVRTSDIRFMNAPVLGTDMINGQSVVLLDHESTAPLWQAMKEDTVQQLIDSGQAPPALGENVL